MDTQKPKNCFKALLAQKLIAEFSKRNLAGFYCETKEAALQKVLDIVPQGSTVSCGGSATLREMGIQRTLKERGYQFFDPDDALGGSAKEEMARQALSVDYYLMSANAISLTGEIVNLDGIGNRVAALSFGPRNVIVIASFNKVEPNLESAILRAKTIAAPQTLLLFKQDYTSYDELSQATEKAYSQLVITNMSIFQGRIKIILVGEALGF